MFEDRTFDNIMRELMEDAPDGIDLRDESIFCDAVASAAVKLSQFYSDMDTVFELVFVVTAVGEYLDRRGQEFNVWRHPALPALYEYSYTGARTPQPGERFFQDGLFFTLRADTDIWPEPYLEADARGSASNNIKAGSNATPMENMPPPSTSTFGVLIVPGTDAETDENYRRRVMEKIAGPAENGNRQHYKTWAESVEGVGRARIIPLFAGPNTVMALVIDPDGLPASQPVVERVQEHIDPMTLGVTVEIAATGEVVPVGDGLGDGRANIGAHFAAVAPEGVVIDIAFAAELEHGANAARVQADALAALTAYLRGLALDTLETENIVVRISSISTRLYALDGLIDHTGLTINGQTANLALTNMQIPVPGDVSIIN